MKALASPFVRIGPALRFVIVAFVLLYEWLFPTIAAFQNSDANTLLLPRVMLQLVYVLLLCMPLVLYRREYGLLHPLILPTLYGLLKGLGKYPIAIFVPFKLPLYSFDVSSSSPAISIQNLDHQQLAEARLEYLALQVLALVCYYAGYFAFRRVRTNGIRFYEPQNLAPICFAATMACVAVGAAFVQVRGGGVSSYLVGLRQGRHSALAGSGQFLQVARFAVLPTLVWFAYRRRLGLNPWWLGAMGAGSLAAIVTTGSRSSLISPLIVLVFLWWRKAGRVVVAPTVGIGLVALVVIGAFGAIRQDYKSQTVNTSVLGLSAFGTNVAHAQAEFAKRSAEESDLAAFVGANQNGMLWGKSYVGSVAFFVPRRLWPGKPFGGGVYNQTINFAGRAVGDQGKSYGIPMGAISESYWNFNLPGVIVIFFLLGMFFRRVSDMVWRNPTDPAALIVAVWLAISFTGTSLSFVNTARDLIMLGGLFYVLKIWRPRLARTTGSRLQVAGAGAGVAVERAAS
jgi:hypothetical protein